MLGTRPDIAFAVSNLSKYVSNPGIIHWKAALHCLLYLKGTIDKCITYKAIYTNPLTLVSFTDSDWAGCHDTRRSHSGGVIFLGGGPISWISQQQINCALSSAEAELNALVLNTKEVLWLRRILDNLSLPQREPTTLYGDNTSSMLIAKEQRINKNTKHIELYFHFIKEEIQQFHSIQLRYIDTKQNIADIFTKGIIGPKLFTQLTGYLFNSIDFITSLNGNYKQPHPNFISNQPTIDELKYKIWKRTDNNKLKDAIDDYNEMTNDDNEDL